MKYLVIEKKTRCSMEIEASCPARAADQTPWPWECVSVHLLGGEHGEKIMDRDGREGCLLLTEPS